MSAADIRIAELEARVARLEAFLDPDGDTLQHDHEDINSTIKWFIQGKVSFRQTAEIFVED